jgi:hypothetical protein
MKQRFRILLHGQNFQSEAESNVSFYTTRYLDAPDIRAATNLAKSKVLQELRQRQILEGQKTTLEVSEIEPVSWMRHRIMGSGKGFTFY